MSRPVRRLTLMLAVAALSLSAASAASADSPPVDGLFNGIGLPSACISDYYAACQSNGTLDDFGAGTVYGNTLYKSFIGGGGGIASYRINEDGSIGARISCISRLTGIGCSVIPSGINGSEYSTRLEIGHGGDTLYAAQSGDTQAGNQPAMLSAFAITPTGQITAFRNCVSSSAVAGCSADTLMVAGYSFSVGDHGIYINSGVDETSFNRVLSYGILGTGAIGARTSCWADTTANGCSVARAYFQPWEMKAHGDTLYLDNYSAGELLAFALNPTTGGITSIRPTVGSLPGQTFYADDLLEFPSSIAFSPDGKTLYQNANDTAPDNVEGSPADYHDYQGRLLALTLDSNGAIGDLKNCVSGATANYAAPAPCTPAAKLMSTGDVASTADGKALYLLGATDYSNNDVHVFKVNSDGGIGAQTSCTTTTTVNPNPACTYEKYVEDEGIFPLANGRAVLFSGFSTAYSLTREIAPVCEPTPSTMELPYPGTAVKRGITCTDANAEPLTYSVTTQPKYGTVSLSGSVATYTPTKGSESDSFAIAASDGHVTVPVTLGVSYSKPSFKTTIKKIGKSVKASKLKGFYGGSATSAGVKKVEIGLIQLPKGTKSAVIAAKTKTCNLLKSTGKFKKVKASKKGACKFSPSLTAKGTTKWSFKLKKKLPKGKYSLVARTTDMLGNVESGKPVTVSFSVK